MKKYDIYSFKGVPEDVKNIVKRLREIDEELGAEFTNCLKELAELPDNTEEIQRLGEIQTMRRFIEYFLYEFEIGKDSTYIL